MARPQHDGSWRTPTGTRPRAERDSKHTRCGGAKSFADDLGLSRGVVLSRAVHFCDLLRLSPLTRRFVRFRRTRLRRRRRFAAFVVVWLRVRRRRRRRRRRRNTEAEGVSRPTTYTQRPTGLIGVSTEEGDSDRGKHHGHRGAAGLGVRIPSS